ncbi:MAG: 16S rRNA (guanine(966)-N(2))-methyltransferase RsmD [Christensenella sp.]
MRIIAGKKRGLILKTRDGLKTRPTLDKVKEAVFGRLQFELQDKCVLDLFAGSGALGLEALSRGAKEAVFVDNDADAGEVIADNIAAAQMEKCALFVKNDYMNALKLFKNAKKFDIVFLDPPYSCDFYADVMQKSVEYGLLENRAIVVAESDTLLEISVKGFTIEKQKKYGKVFLTFFRWEEEQNESMYISGDI